MGLALLFGRASIFLPACIAFDLSTSCSSAIGLVCRSDAGMLAPTTAAAAASPRWARALAAELKTHESRRPCGHCHSPSVAAL